MSFWNTSDNKAIDQTGNFDAGGGDMEPIPKNTQVKACPDEVKWDQVQNSGEQYISIRWNVLAPKEYSGRKIFQKLWVMGNNPNAKNPVEQGDKAKRMLAAINANARGNLMQLQGPPTDSDLQSSLMNKPMALNLQVWEMTTQTGETNKGNWVQKVAPLHQQPQQPMQQPIQQQPMGNLAGNTPMDDDVGF